MSRVTRRRLLGGTALSLVFSQVGAQSLLPRGGDTSGGARQLTTLTLANTSASIEASGFVTPIFSHVFKQGDILAGTAPQFLIGGVPQPYSWGMQSYYPDGSLSRASFMLRCTPSIAKSGVLGVSVCNGGTAPSASSRTLKEVYAQKIQVNVTGASPKGANLTGSWSAYLADDANNLAQYVYMDGQAGTVWRIETEMAQSAGGTPHKGLYCYHYIMALQDARGDLGGFRYLPRIHQPWYNRSDAPAQNWRGFTTAANWQYGSGPTVVGLVWPFSNATFTTTAGSRNFTTPNGNNYYQGANDNNNTVPAYVTATGGTLDSALDPNQIYFINATKGSNTITISQSSGLGYFITAKGDGTGTQTIVPIPVSLQFGSLFFATATGQYHFFRGTGSMTTDGTVRTQFNQAYFHSTGMLPPWDMSLTGIVSTTFPYDWNPCSIGPLQNGRGAAGSNPTLGVMTNYSCVHFYNQSIIDEKAVRIIALAGWVDCTSFRDWTTRQLINFSDNSYAGMPPPSKAQQSAISGGAGGFKYFAGAPPTYNSGFQGEANPAHKPDFCAYACLVYGEPHMLDLMLEIANFGLLSVYPGFRAPTVPTQGYGINTAFGGGGGNRTMAWAARDHFQASKLVRGVTTAPDGSQHYKYVNELADVNAGWPTSVLGPRYVGSYLAGLGAWLSQASDGKAGAACGLYEPGFMDDYLVAAMCIAAGGNQQNGAAKKWLQSFADYRSAIVSRFGGWHLYIEYQHLASQPYSIDGYAGTPIPDANHFGVCTVLTEVRWATTGPQFFSASFNEAGGWSPTNGDIILFDGDGETPPGGFSADTPYWIRDASGSNFNLAAAKGGTVLVPTNRGSVRSGRGNREGASGPWLQASNPPAALTGKVPNNAVAPDGYLNYSYFGSCNMAAVGITGLSDVLHDGLTRIKNNAISYKSAPYWMAQTSF